MYSLLCAPGLRQVDSKRRRLLDEVLVTWTLSFGRWYHWYGSSPFHLAADPVSEHFCTSAIASHAVCADPAANLVI